MIDYNVVWNTFSENSSQSMPLGGHDVGCNVWVEDGQLCIYISKSDFFDENGTMLKAGRIKIWFDKKDVLSENFKQELHLQDGYISVSAGHDGDRVEFLLWCLTNKSQLNIDCNFDKSHKMYVSYDSWRYADRVLENNEERGQCRDCQDSPFKVYTYADTVIAKDNELVFYHNNNNSDLFYDKLIKQQNLDEIKDKVPNPLFNRITGGALVSDNLKFEFVKNKTYAKVPYKEYCYSTTVNEKKQILITIHTGKYDSSEQWHNELKRLTDVNPKHDDSKKWWNEYFNRSYIYLDESNKNSDFYKIGQNYQLFRYMLGCNYYGEYPTKFNGGLFTFDEKFTPDFRQWSGAGFTSQNQRLVYWPMIKSGDFKGMKPQFDFFKNLIECAKARTKLYFGHGGAYFYEQLNFYGLCTGQEYGWNRRDTIPDGVDDCPYTMLHYSTALDFSTMILEYARYSGESIDEYLDFIVNIVEFYFEHYDYDKNGKLNIFPSSALETYKGDNPRGGILEEYGCKNPLDAVAGLKCVIEGCMDYIKDENVKNKFVDYYKHLPDIPKEVYVDNKTVYAPAEKYNKNPFNCELPELYSVFPFSPNGLSDEEIRIGIDTYKKEKLDSRQDWGISWHQNGIFAARLGLKDEAHKYLKIKLGNSGKRFPTFWGPGHDWTPDHNWGGSGMIGLQEMLMQCNGDKIELFKAWDKNIDVSFKLYAPNKTVVICCLKDGEIIDLKVTPKEREKDVIVY